VTASNARERSAATRKELRNELLPIPKSQLTIVDHLTWRLHQCCISVHWLLASSRLVIIIGRLREENCGFSYAKLQFWFQFDFSKNHDFDTDLKNCHSTIVLSNIFLANSVQLFLHLCRSTLPAKALCFVTRKHLSRSLAVTYTITMVISQKQWKIEKLIQTINSKWHMAYRIASLLMTLSDLQGHSY